MPDKNRVGYEAFTKWELELAEGKAKGMVGKHGFTHEDFDDLKQDLLLQIYLKRDVRRGWSEITASERTVMSRILDNRLRDIIDAVHTEKRKVHLYSDPIGDSDESGDNDDGTGGIDEEAIFQRTKQMASDDAKDLPMDLNEAIRELNSTQKRVCELLAEGQSISDVSRKLRIKRTTLNREIDRLRKVFYRRGLKAYV